MGDAEGSQARASHFCQMRLCVLLKRLPRRQKAIDDVVCTLAVQADPASRVNLPEEGKAELEV